MPFANKTRLYWRFEGAQTNPPLVLVNSLGCDMTLWDRVLPSLIEDFRVLRMDMRGHGASESPPGDYSLGMLAEDVTGVMDAAGVQSAPLCGLSLGGMVAMTLACNAPERVSALVLACTSAKMDSAAWQARIDAVSRGGMGAVVDLAMGRFFSQRFLDHHVEIADSFRHAMMAQNPKGYTACCVALRDMSLLDKIDKISCPTLVVGGTNDIATPFEGHGDVIAKAIADSRTLLLDGAHLAPVEAPMAFGAAVRGFLKAPQEGTAQDAPYQKGLAMRRRVLGDAWVDRALASRTAFNSDFQAMITRTAWNEIWNRPGLDRRTRRLLVIAVTAALGRWEEFELHVQSGIERWGFEREELKETLMQLAVYAGVPAANTAFAEAAKILDKIAAK